ncbi:M23 family metallopeptidase [Sphingomonas sp. M1-B02]|uniref:M23 family metallopeptidase n=1 Tax=Sphingomonas sp. M1-B02 TaxID=3114300 RepID=UPI00223EC484|nr:M23 family metallopeptidase [Sphingomonas sp. S6-11]UZK64996.1 M23 family metallopeptidase [Sphingomonas sp. S6-11]
MFLRNDHGIELGGGGTTAPALGAPSSSRALVLSRRRGPFSDFDFAPDLGARIGTLTWYRGAVTCIGLCALTLLLAPGFETPIYGTIAAPLTGSEWDAARAQAIRPLGQGGTTGYRVAATRLVAPLTDTPERPIINLDAKLASGDALLAVLTRSGVGKGDASQVGQLVTRAVSLGEIQPGTMIDLTLGRRIDKSQPRPLQRLAFRAKFDLKLEVARSGSTLALKEIPIAIDHTPLRIQGMIGGSLYRSARAAGAPAKAVESYIRTLATRVPVSRLGSSCKFDIIVKQARAETGEVQLGELMYAGVSQCPSSVQLLPWDSSGKTEWFDASGRGQKTGMMAMPVAGRITSNYGFRVHPLLRFKRMHKGMDIGAPYGAPIYAATDGVVAMAGRNGGYGNFVKLNHAGGFATGYGHMSRIYVRNGERVRKGQPIGAVGSSGMSTGPHLHYELYRNGAAVNPRSVSFASERRLDGGDLGAFKAKLGQLLAVPVGRGALKDD